MAGMRCRHCFHLKRCKKDGIIATSKMCENWKPNWEKMPQELKFVRDNLPRLLKNRSVYGIFEQWWFGEKIQTPLSSETGKRCDACYWWKHRRSVHPACCKDKTLSSSDSGCKWWHLDLERKTLAEDCPPLLKKMVEASLQIAPKFRPHVRFFIHKYKQLKKHPAVNINDTIVFEYTPKIRIKARVTDLTPEHVLAESKKVRLMLLHTSHCRNFWVKRNKKAKLKNINKLNKLAENMILEKIKNENL